MKKFHLFLPFKFLGDQWSVISFQPWSIVPLSEILLDRNRLSP
jgi:hypothetical protein